MRRAVVGVAGGLLLASVTVGCGSSSGSSTDVPAAASSAAAAIRSAVAAAPTDVPAASGSGQGTATAKIESCGTDKDGYGDAKVTVTNTGSASGTFIVPVSFTTPTGHLVGAAAATVTVEPGETSSPQDVNTGMDAGGETLTCDLGDVASLPG